ncbi:MAG: phosphoenolpyruvate--protein phosphotransferase [Rhizobacter sp.]|nr:phosphoenolpyruvate--protein phosphotransferase [Chlorobiales bacterium]
MARTPKRPPQPAASATPAAAVVTEHVFAGLAASRGIVIGPVYLYRHDHISIDSEHIAAEDIELELSRFKAACERSEKELTKIASVTEQKIGTTYSAIFDAQIMMLHDRTLIDLITYRIRTELKGAGAVVDEEISKYQKLLLQSGEALFRERATDIADLKDRIIRNLRSEQLISHIDENCIVVANMLTPADVILFSRQSIKGCATDTGGVTSHAALICSSLNLPMVVGLHHISEQVKNGDQIIIDGYDGKVIINPQPETIEFYTRKQKRRAMSMSELGRLTSAETRTKCKHRIFLYSNIDFKEELASIEKFGSEGVGLFRSESLFISRGKPPSEQEQFDYYSELVRAIPARPLVVRLFDVGGDKMLFASYKEENPNLGWRGVRILIDVPEILESQLRAVFRAAALGGRLQIMLPMISSMEEVRAVKKVIAKVKTDLRKEKIAFGDAVPLGVMIEVPAAVEIIDDLTKELDFVSIGTNDLIQYTLAVDRNNGIVQSLYKKFHPAIVRMVSRVIKAAKRNSCRVSMCGEMASDPNALVLLLGLGLAEFSVVSSAIPEMKKMIAGIRLSDARKVAAKCLTLGTALEIEHTLKHARPQA